MRPIRGAVRQQFELARQAVPDYEIGFAPELALATDIKVERGRGGRFWLLFSPTEPTWEEYAFLRSYSACCLFWFQQSRIAKWATFSVTDGNRPSHARFSFSSRSSDVVPVPDPRFFAQCAYREVADFASANSVDWADRRGELVWRGGLNGDGVFLTEPGAILAHPNAIQRLRLWAMGQRLGLDIRFVLSGPPTYHKKMTDQGAMVGPGVHSNEWCAMKVALDIDGFTNTWDNLPVRMLMGCCVLWVESAYGYRMWYHDRLRAWEHYVPVRADLGDLEARLEWVRANDREAAEIARRGQNFARGLDFCEESALAGRIIDTHWET
ncbi:glycosyl transferase family 90 [Aestuariibius sp. 2305UL40-4]|uniref:glycosyl transferase family 90 n=1 Tax=Aestuariibius violaceus TaxID=3234132 RepID=UPI00345EB363